MPSRGLFIGIDHYSFEPLTSCVNDAVAMRDCFVALGLLAQAECTLMTAPSVPGSRGEPTREGILDALLTLYDAQEPVDRLFVYFSGHGLSARLGREANALRTVIVPAGVTQLTNSGNRLIDLDELVGRFPPPRSAAAGLDRRCLPKRAERIFECCDDRLGYTPAG